MTMPGDQLNWQEVSPRLDQTDPAAEPGAGRAPEEVRRVLRERARALAKPSTETRSGTKDLDLVIFSLARERYGVESGYVLDVVPVRNLTRVPCTPSFILGLVSHHGLILPVLDLRRILALPVSSAREGCHLVAVEAGGMKFGIAAEGVEGAIQVSSDEIAPDTASNHGTAQSFIRGVTREMIVVLDLEALVQDQRIVVNEEVG